MLTTLTMQFPEYSTFVDIGGHQSSGDGRDYRAWHHHHFNLGGWSGGQFVVNRELSEPCQFYVIESQTALFPFAIRTCNCSFELDSPHRPPTAGLSDQDQYAPSLCL